ncbi:hypothetical protein I308_103985 [Cryptococcus tetragattii IND107]|uniref:Uncharacterized protein n=1 Tax=Cryptococcus tetragattii IND107 TaxID=1296105 RepID=A0ABR3BRU7_9TREE
MNDRLLYREALGRFLSYFSPQETHYKIHIYNYARKSTESEEDVKRKVFKISRREYAKKREFDLLCPRKEAREEPGGLQILWAPLNASQSKRGKEIISNPYIT